MSLFYCAVARGPTLLCSFQAPGSRTDYNAVAERMLGNIPTRNDAKTTYAGHDNCTFHVIVNNGIIFLCGADVQFRKQRAYAFLEQVQSRFSSGSLLTRATAAGYLEFQRDFQHVLSTEMDTYARDEGDNVKKLQAQVDEVKGVMTQNIERVLERGEKLDTLMEKTTELEASASTFQKSAGKLKKKMWWSNMKMKICIAVTVPLVILIIVIIVLFSTHVLPPKAVSSDTTTTPAP